MAGVKVWCEGRNCNKVSRCTPFHSQNWWMDLRRSTLEQVWINQSVAFWNNSAYCFSSYDFQDCTTNLFSALCDYWPDQQKGQRVEIFGRMFVALGLWPWVCDPPFSLVPLVLLPRTGNHKSELLLLSLGLGARDTTVASVLFWLHLYKLEQAEMKRKVKCSRFKPQRRFTRSDKKPTSHLSPHLPLV